MPTKTDKMLLYIESQLKEADAELTRIPPGSPSYHIQRRLILCTKDLVEVIRGLMPEPGEVSQARTLAAELDFSDSILPGTLPGTETRHLPRSPGFDITDRDRQ